MSTTTQHKTAREQVTFTDYSAKSFVVRGNTKPIKELMGQLGGKFNYGLKGGPGWIFSSKRKVQVDTRLLSTPASPVQDEDNSDDAAHEAEAADRWAAKNL